MVDFTTMNALTRMKPMESMTPMGEDPKKKSGRTLCPDPPDCFNAPLAVHHKIQDQKVKMFPLSHVFFQNCKICIRSHRKYPVCFLEIRF